MQFSSFCTTIRERNLLKDDRSSIARDNAHQDGCTQKRVLVSRFHCFSLSCFRTSFDESLAATTVRIALSSSSVLCFFRIFSLCTAFPRDPTSPGVRLFSDTSPLYSALYAHKVHSGFWHDVNKPESFGFAAHQVTPFNVSTPDSEVLYAWHILPLATVASNRDTLAAADPFDQTLPLQLLKSDPQARVVVNCESSLCL